MKNVSGFWTNVVIPYLKFLFYGNIRRETKYFELVIPNFRDGQKFLCLPIYEP